MVHKNPSGPRCPKKVSASIAVKPETMVVSSWPKWMVRSIRNSYNHRTNVTLLLIAGKEKCTKMVDE
jgi:hypothetical protein